MADFTFATGHVQKLRNILINPVPSHNTLYIQTIGTRACDLAASGGPSRHSRESSLIGQTVSTPARALRLCWSDFFNLHRASLAPPVRTFQLCTCKVCSAGQTFNLYASSLCSIRLFNSHVQVQSAGQTLQLARASSLPADQTFQLARAVLLWPVRLFNLYVQSSPPAGQTFFNLHAQVRSADQTFQLASCECHSAGQTLQLACASSLCRSDFSTCMCKLAPPVRLFNLHAKVPNFAPDLLP